MAIGARFDPYEEPASVETAQARLDWQEEIVSTLADGLREMVREQLDDQEAALETVYKPITRSVTAKVREQRHALDRMATALDGEARARLAAQSAEIARIKRLLREAGAEEEYCDEQPAPGDDARGDTSSGGAGAPRAAPPAPGAGRNGQPAPAPDGCVWRRTDYTVVMGPGCEAPVDACYDEAGARWRLRAAWPNGDPLPDDALGVGNVYGDGSISPPHGDGWDMRGARAIRLLPPAPPDIIGSLWLRWSLISPPEDCAAPPPGDELPPPGEEPPPDELPPPREEPPPPDEDDKEGQSKCEVKPPEECLAPVEPAGGAAVLTVCKADQLTSGYVRRVDSELQQFAALGKTLEEMFDKVMTEVANLPIRVANLRGNKVVGFIVAPMAEGLAEVGSIIYQAYTYAMKTVGNSLGESRDVLVGLYFTRALIQAAESLAFGVNVVANANMTFRLEMTQLMSVVNYLINYVCPVVVPTPDALVSLRLSQQADEPSYRAMMKMHGVQPAVSDALAQAQRARPTAGQLMQLRLRGLIGQSALDNQLEQLGWLNESDRQRFGQLADFLPPPSDLIRFAVKDVFDPNKLGLSEMRGELEEQQELLALLAQQGIRTIKGDDGKGGLKDWEVPLYYWIASYDEISPTQSYLMLQRLRPDRVRRYTQRLKPTAEQLRTGVVAGATVLDRSDPDSWLIAPSPMGISDVQKLLKEKDYNPIWRHRLAAISYRPIGRIDARKMYQLGVFGAPLLSAGIREVAPGRWEATGVAEVELYAQFQDQGYAPADAMAQTVLAIREVEKQHRVQQQRGLKVAVCQLYTAGGISEPDAMRRLTDAGFPDAEAAFTVADCDLRKSVRMIKAHTSAVRKLFMRGAADRVEAARMLGTAGLQAGAITELLDLWSVQRAGEGPEVRAREMCDWAGSGLIAYPEMARRLTNQGHSPTDVDRILRHCQLGHAARSAKEQRALARAQETQRRREEAERRRMAQDAAREEAIPERGVRAAEKAKEIAGWWKKKIVTEDQVREMLASKRWLPENIQRWMQANKPAE